MKKTCLISVSSLKFKNKLKKYLSEGYPQKQALAMTYSHFRKNPIVTLVKNPNKIASIKSILSKAHNLNPDLNVSSITKFEKYIADNLKLDIFKRLFFAGFGGEIQLTFKLKPNEKPPDEEKLASLINLLNNEGYDFRFEEYDGFYVFHLFDIINYSKNPDNSNQIFSSPAELREFLNKHLKDKWSWRKNEIFVRTGPGNWAVARRVEQFFLMIGFGGAGSEMDPLTGDVYVRAYVPKNIMKLKEKE